MCFTGLVGLDEQSAKMGACGPEILGAAFVVECQALEAISPTGLCPAIVSPHDLIVSSILLFCPWRDLSK